MGFMLSLLIALGVAPPAGAPASGGLSYVQATVVSPDASARSLSFVDASGRSRSHAVSGPPAPAVSDASAASDAAAAADDSQWTVVPAVQMRPTWPNPYSRFYTGPKPTARLAPRH